MDTMIAFCGLDCGKYPIHLATLEQDKSSQHAMQHRLQNNLTNITELICTLKISMIVTDARSKMEGYLRDVSNAISGNVQLGKIWKTAHYVPIIHVIVSISSFCLILVLKPGLKKFEKQIKNKQFVQINKIK